VTGLWYFDSVTGGDLLQNPILAGLGAVVVCVFAVGFIRDRWRRR
jgi:hypothetical protein